MRHPRVRIPTILLFAALVSVVACGGPINVGNGSPGVGGACNDDFDCEGTCLRGGDFPDGTCSFECRDDGDCPVGTACIDTKGGVCLLLCDRDSDCRGGYECDDKDREGHGGEARVCID